MISVVTPLHAPGNAFIAQTHVSLLEAGLEHFEWVILENAGGKVPEVVRADKRVRVYPSDATGVGALKRLACALAKGDFLVELDADDLLAPGALRRIAKAFEKTRADFVYSDFAEFKDATFESNVYSAAFGWESYPVEFQGRPVRAMRAPAVTAHNLRLVDWAPNHVRAWRRTRYDALGGHNPAMPVGDDHDLCVRFFLAGAMFAYVPKCLYFYRVHAGNTVAARNDEIRKATHAVYERYVFELAAAFAKQKGLAKVDLCGAHDAPADYLVLDREVELPGPEPGSPPVFPDLEGRWPLRDSSVGVLRAHDAVEHLKDPIHTMNEAYRVLAPGGWLMISVPSTNGLGAFCDPTHKSYWNKLSFRYYTDPVFSRYLPGFVGRFQLARSPVEWFPSDWHRQENVPYVDCQLFALKDGWRAMGEVRF